MLWSGCWRGCTSSCLIVLFEWIIQWFQIHLCIEYRSFFVSVVVVDIVWSERTFEIFFRYFFITVNYVILSCFCFCKQCENNKLVLELERERKHFITLLAKQILTLSEAFQMISSTEQKPSASYLCNSLVHSRRGLKILSRMFDTSSDLMFEQEMEKQKPKNLWLFRLDI